MLSRFSVKRPYTVWVAVAMVLVLGYISLTNMTADLLPSIDLPYSVVYTSYIGASPDEVEQQVTRPVESALATVSNIEKISSVSSENVSMVILQFADGSSMDTANLEMREKLDITKAAWSEKIGSPVIMNINPDMLPVMIAAVAVKDLSGAELNDYVSQRVINRLESLEGVARVTESGGVTESVEIEINQEKLSQKNDEVKNALDKKFDEAKKELSDAKKEIKEGISKTDDGLKKIESTKKTLNEKHTELVNQLSDAKSKADDSLSEIVETKLELNNKLTVLNTQKANLLTSRAQLDDPAVAMLMPEDVLAARIVELDTAIAQIDAAISQINETMEQLDAGEIAAKEAKAELEKQEALSSYQLYSALAETAAAGSGLTGTRSQLEGGLTQIENSEKTLEETIESTYEKLDLTKMITGSLLGSIITAQNFSMPAGYIMEGGSEDVLVRVGNKFSDTDSMEALTLMDLGLDDVEPIKLGEVADIRVTDNSADLYVKINGEDGIILTLDKQTGHSTGVVSDTIQDGFKALEEEYEGLGFTVLMDQGIYIDYVTQSVFTNLLWGALFAVIVLIIFLRSAKPTIIIAVSIPVSLLAAVAAMYFSGISINMITLSGLALSVGMLVDNSIVVIENIYRLRSEGAPLLRACTEGARQVAGAIIASTLTTCCVFLPIVFTTGLTRQLFSDLGLTVTYSLLASLLIALTVVPAMSSGILKKAPEKKDRFFLWLQKAYGRLSGALLNHKWIPIVLSVVLLFGSGYLAYKNGSSFMPQMEMTQLSIDVTVPEGTGFEKQKEIGDEITKRILTIDDVVTIGTMSSNGSSTGMSLVSMGSSRSNLSSYVILKEDKKLSNSEISQKILDLTADMDCEVKVDATVSDMALISGGNTTVRITGNDTDELIRLTNELTEKLQTIKGLDNIDNGLDDSKLEIRVSVDKDKAAGYNLTVAQVYQQIYAKIGSAVSTTTLSTLSKDFSVYIKNSESDTYSYEDLTSADLNATDNEGGSVVVKLSDIASFEKVQGLSSIRRTEQIRSMSVTADVKDGYNIGNIGNEIQSKINEMDVPSGYSVTLAGQNETINEALSQMLLMVGMAVLFVYLVMVAQFQSLKMPFIIMFTVPFAFTGGFLGLIICGMDLSVVSILGFIVLTGVIVNNGIVLVDYINQLRLSGMPKREAIIEAGRIRLRPILMTAITTILGLIMMALGVGMGSEVIQPMAVVTIGGMTYGTLLTLLLIPVIYDIITGKKELKSRKIEGE